MAGRKKAIETPAQRLKRETQQAVREHWELWLLRDIRARRLPEPLRQYQWHPTRDYRADVAWVAEQLMVEVDGGLNVGRRNRKQQARDAQLDALAAVAGTEPPKRQRAGGHNSPDGYEHDRIRDAEALCLGWTVLRVTPGMVERGAAVDYIERVLHAIWQQNKRNKAAA